jgi:hypothetical protein
MTSHMWFTFRLHNSLPVEALAEAPPVSEVGLAAERL